MASPYSLLAGLDEVRHKDKPPLHLWNPDNVSDIDMTIEADGSWTYLGTPITRDRLAHLFSTVLRREQDGEYYLVTPVEKCRIKVVDAPFIAVLLQELGDGKDQSLTLTTNMADEVTVDAEHPLRVVEDAGETLIYAMVRNGLEAKLSRNVYYQLAELLVEENGEVGAWSENVFFPLMKT
ncbi:MAG TPA: DUF1285 domain-containing protein [Gammaproteobacteria bacterium]|nr:DUF1285 domain-containing protein [Gammaproteobacteria bacterium]|tara:strand:+ start:1472 stop:2011 length:540 start_codon:yes stop_codon:yes gene_type:complete